MKRVPSRKLVWGIVFVMLAMAGAVWAAEDGKININTASADELVKLEGVGEAIAARIVEFREKNGPFEKPEDLMKVKGIGQKIFEKNADRIVLE